MENMFKRATLGIIVIIALLFTVYSASAALTDNVVLVWELQTNGSVPDATGNGLNGTLLNSPPFMSGDGYNITGNAGGGGTGQAIYSGDLDTYLNVDSDFCFEVWTDWSFGVIP